MGAHPEVGREGASRGGGGMAGFRGGGGGLEGEHPGVGEGAWRGKHPGVGRDGEIQGWGRGFGGGASRGG